MVAVMKVLAVLLSGFLGAAFGAAQNVRLAKVGSVYLLPMANGFDQYLANRITNAGVFQVVADPKLADAILTDQLGEAFERKLAELYPQAAPAAAAKGDKEEKGEGEADAAGSRSVNDDTMPRVSSFSRARGTLFLVDGHSRSVVWSIYQKPKSTTPEQLDRTAGQIVSMLARELKRK
jgi:hypothetical protein